MNDRIEWYVYKPQDWQASLGYRRVPDRCAARVSNDYGVGFHQCARKPTTTLHGYGFCTQHAKIIRKRLGE